MISLKYIAKKLGMTKTPITFNFILLVLYVSIQAIPVFASIKEPSISIIDNSELIRMGEQYNTSSQYEIDQYYTPTYVWVDELREMDTMLSETQGLSGSYTEPFRKMEERIRQVEMSTMDRMKDWSTSYSPTQGSWKRMAAGYDMAYGELLISYKLPLVEPVSRVMSGRGLGHRFGMTVNAIMAGTIPPENGVRFCISEVAKFSEFRMFDPMTQTIPHLTMSNQSQYVTEQKTSMRQPKVDYTWRSGEGLFNTTTPVSDAIKIYEDAANWHQAYKLDILNQSTPENWIKNGLRAAWQDIVSYGCLSVATAIETEIPGVPLSPLSVERYSNMLTAPGMTARQRWYGAGGLILEGAIPIAINRLSPKFKLVKGIDVAQDLMGAEQFGWKLGSKMYEISAPPSALTDEMMRIQESEKMLREQKLSMRENFNKQLDNFNRMESKNLRDLANLRDIQIPSGLGKEYRLVSRIDFSSLERDLISDNYNFREFANLRDFSPSTMTDLRMNQDLTSVNYNFREFTSLRDIGFPKTIQYYHNSIDSPFNNVRFQTDIKIDYSFRDRMSPFDRIDTLRFDMPNFDSYNIPDISYTPSFDTYDMPSFDMPSIGGY